MTSVDKTQSPPAKQVEDVAKAAASSPTQEDDPNKAIVIRFASNDKPLGRTISYVIKSLRDGSRPVVLQGSGLAMTKVVTVAGIARDRVGDIHQICEFLTIASSREGGPDATGIQITLQSKDVDAKALEAIGYSEPLKKGFMLAELPESARRRYLGRRKNGQPPTDRRPKSAAATNAAKQADSKVEKKAERPAASSTSPKARDASTRSKKKQNREKKPAADKKAAEEAAFGKAEEQNAAASEKPKKRQKRRNNNNNAGSSKQATLDENQPPASQINSGRGAYEARTPADKKGNANGQQSNMSDKEFKGGSAVRRGPPRYFYDNYDYRYPSEQHFTPAQYRGPHPGYYGSPNGYGASPVASNGYQQRSPYMGGGRGGNQRQMYQQQQQQARYQNYPVYQSNRGRYGGGGYPANRGFVGDLSGNTLQSQQRSSGSRRDDELEPTYGKREVGTRGSI